MIKIFPWQRYGNWLALVAWMGVIFWFSSQPDLKSGLETWQDLVLRKIAHFAEYLVLAYWFLRCSGYPRFQAWPAAAAVAFALLVASADETYQTTVRGRHGSPLDVLVDGSGAVALVLLHWRLHAVKPPAVDPRYEGLPD